MQRTHGGAPVAARPSRRARAPACCRSPVENEVSLPRGLAARGALGLDNAGTLHGGDHAVPWGGWDLGVEASGFASRKPCCGRSRARARLPRRWMRCVQGARRCGAAEARGTHQQNVWPHPGLNECALEKSSPLRRMAGRRWVGAACMRAGVTHACVHAAAWPALQSPQRAAVCRCAHSSWPAPADCAP